MGATNTKAVLKKIKENDPTITTLDLSLCGIYLIIITIELTN